MGHELDLVLGNQAVLAVVTPEPLAHEAFVQVDRTYPVADVEILVDGEENLADHIEQDRLGGELAQVVHRADHLEEPVGVGLRDVAA